MKVLLRRDVEGVGRRGDIVDVTGGYARNFLLPSGSALKASDGVAGQATSMRRSRDLRDAQGHAAAETQKAELERSTVRVAARAAAHGKLFGSVGPVEIATAGAAATGVDVDRGQVVLDEHLKELGAAAVTITLFGGVTATVSFEVVPLD
jgi:large subunit ribosomal protein L9